MRFSVTLKALDRNTALPLNYQYPLSAWIYRTLEQGDAELAEFLHEEGYVGDSHRRFKFYSFSELRTPGARVQGDRLLLRQDEVHFHIAFLANKAAETMIMGLFNRAEPSRLGDSVSGGRFAVSSVRMERIPTLNGQADYFTVSPAIISVAALNEAGKPGKRFLSPLEEGFESQFIGNLRSKYHIAHQAGLLPDAPFEPIIGYELLSDHAKEKRIDLMRGQPGYTRVRGYKFRFRLHAPESVLRLALLAGVGEKNAMGFGGVELVGG